jgi:Ser/Thr protein kinase RdoA (MazF antagonist)
MSAAAPLPFDALEPERVLDCVEALGVRCDGRLLALNSYENRVYQVGIEDGEPLVAKFYRPARWSDAQILEEHAFLAELAAAEVPAVAPIARDGKTLFHLHGYRYTLFPRRGGRAPDLSMPDQLEWLGRFIGRIHLVGGARRFAHRPRLDPAAQGTEALAFLRAGGFVPEYLRPAWETAARELLDGLAAAFDAYGPLATLRLHGDCHPGNVLWTDSGPHFVDFDDCLTGPAIQDLWMLLAGSRAEIAAQLRALLGGYEDFRPFERTELALVEPLRAFRMIQHTAWIARRWTDPAFPRAFTWFGTARYWEEQVHAWREQLERLAEPAVDPERE